MIEKKLKQLGRPKPKDSTFELNLKKRLMNSYQADKAPDPKEVPAETPKKQRVFFLGRMGIMTFVMAIFCVFTLGGTMAYFSFPGVKETVNDLVGIEETGVLAVNSEPDDATLYINGEFFGKTPFEQEMPVGNYSIRIQKEDYEDYFTPVKIKEGETEKIEAELVSLIPEDEYEGWFTYNNEELGFGFRYPGEWEISENGDQDYVVSLEDDYVIATLTHQKLYDMDSAIPENYTQIQIGEGTAYVLLVDNNIERAIFPLESKGQYLVVNMDVKSGMEIPFVSEESDLLRKFLESVWFDSVDSNDTVETYKPPVSNVKDRFVWQRGDTVYSMDNQGNDMRNFDFAGKEIKLLSPDGKWILFNENNGISIIDTLGENYQKLLLPQSSQEGINAIYAVETTGWAPNSRYFAYRLYLFDYNKCNDGFCEPGRGTQVDSGLGMQNGYYIFDTENGATMYLKDSRRLFIGNWDNMSDRFYMGSTMGDEYFFLREYELGLGYGEAEFHDYVLESDPDYQAYQYDVHNRQSVVLRKGGMDDAGIYMAKLEGNEIIIGTKLKGISEWDEYEFPRFSKNADFLFFNYHEFYGFENGTFVKLDGELYEYEYVRVIEQGKVIAIRYRDDAGHPAPATAVVINLTENKIVKFVLETKEAEKITLPVVEIN